MADPSESAHPLENLRSVAEPSCASSDSTYATASLASDMESSIPSSSTTFSSACSESMSSERRKMETSVEDAIERSKVHWSELTELSESDEEEAEVSNVEVFRSLQRHPTFGDGGIHDLGELKVDQKFAEGGQAELYHAHVTWKDPKFTWIDQKLGYKFVLKVFRKGTFLRDLQKQWPEGIFQDYEEFVKRESCGESHPMRYTSEIICGTLLQDGRFAFLFVRENEDLRTLIDHCMKVRSCNDFGPFSREKAIQIMSNIARGMVELHNLNIVHRDFKASNVLCSQFNRKKGTYVWDYNVAGVEVAIGDDFAFFIADFECSIGVVGTGFFRALEILQALKNKALNKNPNLFTKEANVYSYGCCVMRS